MPESRIVASGDINFGKSSPWKNSKIGKGRKKVICASELFKNNIIIISIIIYTLKISNLFRKLNLEISLWEVCGVYFLYTLFL